MSSHAKAPSGGSIWGLSVALLLTVASLGVFSAPAFAAAGHSVVRTFSTAANQHPYAIATDSDGNVYLINGGMGIEKFDAVGNPVAFTSGADYIDGNRITASSNAPFLTPAFQMHDIAVDSSGGPGDGNIYLAGGEDNQSRIMAFDSSGEYLGRFESEAGAHEQFVAVSPADGSVYSGLIRQPRTDDGRPALVVQFPPPTGDPALATPTGRMKAPGIDGEATGTRIAQVLGVDNSGNVYLVDRSSGGVAKADPSQFIANGPLPTPTLTNIPVPGFSALVVDPSSGDFYLTSAINNTEVAISKTDPAGNQQGSPFGRVQGSDIALGASGNVLALNNTGGVFVFSPNEVQLPTGSTDGASVVTPDSATVEGTADPDGAGDIIACEVRYGETTGYSDGSAPCSPGGAISSPTAVSANLTGLVSGTTYHYRLFLTNANGTQMAGADQTLLTTAASSDVSTGIATQVGKDSAVLNGSYTGDGQDLHYFFEWGKTNAYGQTTPVPPGADAGTATGPQNVAPIQISGLRADTTYHYRLVVSTASGITRGQDESFTTPTAVTNLSADPATDITGHSAELHGSFDGDGSLETHYFYEWGPSTAYGNTTPAPPGNAVPAGNGRIDLAGEVISGLQLDTTYHYRVVASNSSGTTRSADATFRTAAAPLARAGFRNVQETSAELTGKVNPRRSDTNYHFEWGPSTGYGKQVPVPDAAIGSGNAPVAVTAQLTGLTPGVVYHFRLVATNQYGTTTTPDQTFAFSRPNCPNAQLRQETRSNELPDCRAYELVTPSDAQGAVVFPLNAPPAPLATSPSRIAYSTAFGTFPDDGTGHDPSNLAGDLYVSTRTDGGWTYKFIGPSAHEALMVGGPPRAFVETFLQGRRVTSRTQLGVQATPALDRIVTYSRGWPDNTQVMLRPASNAPYVWNTATGNFLARWPTNLAQVPNGESFVGRPQVSPDFSHFVFSSNIPFAQGGIDVPRTINGPDGPVEPPASIYNNDLKSGAVELISVKSDNTTTFTGYVLKVSEDGSHVLMSETSPQNSTPESPQWLVPPGVEPLFEIPGPLYLRAGKHTYEIAPGHLVTYVGMLDDGKTVYLTSREQLAPADQDHSVDLYSWHQSTEQLTLVSVGDSGSTGNTDRCGGITWNGGKCNIEVIDLLKYAGNAQASSNNGAGGNGSSDSAIASKSGDIYFISPERLVAGQGEPGQANLFLSRQGSLSFVATLKPGGFCNPPSNGQAATGNTCSTGPVARMQIAPNGDHMAFVTTSNVTGYDSADHTEMYTYEPETGKIECASCRPDGAPPTKDVFGSANGLFQTYDGRVFFYTNEALVPRDTNGLQDVYEYTEGRAQLITTGVGSETDVYNGAQGSNATTGLVSVSASGTDVYFASVDTLVTQDHNGASLKIYDARTGGGFPAEVTPSKCVAADECHGAGASPPATAPDRTSADLGRKAKPKAHKAKKHKKKKAHKKRKHTKNKRKAPKASSKGRSNRG